MNRSSENPTGTLTIRDAEALGRHRSLGRLRYKDLNAGYCRGCEQVVGVVCPNCGVESPIHAPKEPIFRIQHPIETDFYDGYRWVSTECSKCDFKFRVMMK